MSKIGKKPILIPDEVEVELGDNRVKLKGPKGSLIFHLPSSVKVAFRDRKIVVAPSAQSKQGKADWGTARSILNNAVIGVTKGFEKKLLIEGVGYRANMEGHTLILNIGLSHPVKISPPAGISISVDKNVIRVSGADKTLVGQLAADIRAERPAEPYKGKGIRYENEVIRRKAGKRVAGAAK